MPSTITGESQSILEFGQGCAEVFGSTSMCALENTAGLAAAAWPSRCCIFPGGWMSGTHQAAARNGTMPVTNELEAYSGAVELRAFRTL